MSTRVPAADLIVGDILLDVSREPDYAARVLSIETLPDGRLLAGLLFAYNTRFVANVALVMNPQEIRRTA